MSKISYLIQKLMPRSELARQVSVLTSGTVIAQVIPIAVTPILTRIYTPLDFGILALYTAVTSIFAVISTGSYDQAVMLPKQNRDAAHVVATSLIITTIVSIVLLLTMLVFSSSVKSFVPSEKSGSWLYFVPISVLMLGFNQTATYWCSRNQQYKLLSMSRIAQTSTTTGLQLIFGVLGFASTGLVASVSLGLSLFAVILMTASNRPRLFAQGNFSTARLKIHARRHVGMPLFSMTTTLLETVSAQAISLLTGRWFGMAMLGHYTMSVRLLSAPASLIGSSVSQVFYQKFSHLRNKQQEQKQLLFYIWKRLALVGLVPFSIITFFGQDIITMLLGQSWQQAGRLAMIIAPMLFFMFVSSPTSMIYIAIGREKMNLIYGLVTTVYRILALWLCWKYGTFEKALVILVICEIVKIVIYNIVALRMLAVDSK